MIKVDFIKTQTGICIYLDDGLFKNDIIKLEKIVEILKLFKLESATVTADFFIDEGEPFLNLLL